MLIHEAYALSSYSRLTPAWQEFRRTHHTSSLELAKIATEAKPGLLVLYHRSNAGGGEAHQDDEQELIGEIRRACSGHVVRVAISMPFDPRSTGGQPL